METHINKISPWEGDDVEIIDGIYAGNKGKIEGVTNHVDESYIPENIYNHEQSNAPGSIKNWKAAVRLESGKLICTSINNLKKVEQ